ncbi:hypothetical protein FDECE_6428 [Fusarium decemcellulare]|uniref:Uncharacterized protein n=1 Tax=Fusarium decemcellulare TaxID=57161 RepID=A0ACC1RHS2_9HYPO|nr:hypothetical protein FDECE_6428 [Fusarium decemcellulare]KAJ3519781.1 hypothetical protein NM208_g13988 [Fusarium decemcellulare]
MATDGADPDASNAHMLYIPIAIFGVLCPALVATRVWSRLRKGGHLGGDDYTIIASLVFALASSGLEIASCHYGFGRHSSSLEPEEKTEALKFFYVCQVTYKASINLTKCSIVLLYLRIFGKVRWFKWLCWFLVICVGIYAISSVTVTIFQCTPIQRAYNKAIDGTCIDNGKFWYANAGFSIATDLIILFMPMASVYQLQIQQIQKIALIIVFALGGFVVITSCLRVTTIDIAATTADTTYDISSTMWTVIEMNVAIVCACLPMIRPLIVKFFPRLMPKSSSNNPKYGTPSYGTKSFAHSQARDKNEWIQIDAGRNGIPLTSVRKAGSTGSEESILGPQVEAGSNLGPPWPAENSDPMSIQKTVQYSVEYSKNHSQEDK